MYVVWIPKDPDLLHVDSEGSDQTARMRRLICVFADRTRDTLLYPGSYVHVIITRSVSQTVLFLALYSLTYKMKTSDIFFLLYTENKTLHFI